MTRLFPKMIACLIVLSGAFLFTGCTYAPGTPDPETLPGTAYPQVVGLDGLDDRELLLDAPRVAPETDDGRPMSVTVPIRTKIRKEIPVQYRFKFLDERGLPIGEEATWQYALLQPRARTFLTGNAPDIGAVDWLCEIRPNRVERLR